MFLVLSGEGPSDIGIQNDKIGPMTKLIEQWISRRSGYSLIECAVHHFHRRTACRNCQND
jgi:hypothetical protein